MAFYYNHPSDNIIGSATQSLPSGTANSTYPIANLKDGSPASPFRLTTTTGRIVWDFGSAVTIYLVALIHHNLTAGKLVAIEANASDSWTSPTYSQAIAIGSADYENYRPNAYLNLTGTSSHGAFRYWSLEMLDAHAGAITLGEIWLCNVIRSLTHAYPLGFARTDKRPGRQVFPTRAGVEFVNPSVGRQRCLAGEITTTDAGMQALQNWHVACGGQDQPTLIVPNAPDWTDAGLVRWMGDHEFSGVDGGVNKVKVAWCEVARGAPWA